MNLPKLVLLLMTFLLHPQLLSSNGENQRPAIDLSLNVPIQANQDLTVAQEYNGIPRIILYPSICLFISLCTAAYGQRDFILNDLSDYLDKLAIQGFYPGQQLYDCA